MLDCRGYRTPSLRGIPPAGQYGKASLSRGKMRIPRRRSHLLILRMTNTANSSYSRGRNRVGAAGRNSAIVMLDVETIGIISSACICDGRPGRLLFERIWRDSTKKGGEVQTTLDSKS
jgi:hypothetical protein